MYMSRPRWNWTTRLAPAERSVASCSWWIACAPGYVEDAPARIPHPLLEVHFLGVDEEVGVQVAHLLGGLGAGPASRRTAPSPTSRTPPPPGARRRPGSRAGGAGTAPGRGPCPGREPPGAGDRASVGVEQLGARRGRLWVVSQRGQQGLGGAREDLGVLVEQQAKRRACLAKSSELFSARPALRSRAIIRILESGARPPAPSRHRRRCRARGSRGRCRADACERSTPGRHQQLPAIRVHYAVGQVHRPKSSRMRVQIVDPPAYTPPYDHALCAALARAGAEVELVTSRFAHGPVPSAEGYRVTEAFYRRSAGRGSAAVATGVEARRAPRRHAALPPRRRTSRPRPLPVAHGAGTGQPALARGAAKGVDHTWLAAKEAWRGDPAAGFAGCGSAWTRSSTLSEHGARRLADEAGIPAERVRVIPHGALDYLTRLPDPEPLPRSWPR